MLTLTSKVVQWKPVHTDTAQPFRSHPMVGGSSLKCIVCGTGKHLTVVKVSLDISCLCRSKLTPVIKVLS